MKRAEALISQLDAATDKFPFVAIVVKVGDDARFISGDEADGFENLEHEVGLGGEPIADGKQLGHRLQDVRLGGTAGKKQRRDQARTHCLAGRPKVLAQYPGIIAETDEPEPGERLEIVFFLLGRAQVQRQLQALP